MNTRASLSHSVPVYSPSICQYQITLLGDRGTCVSTTWQRSHSTVQWPGFNTLYLQLQVQRHNQYYNKWVSTLMCHQTQLGGGQLSIGTTHDSGSHVDLLANTAKGHFEGDITLLKNHLTSSSVKISDVPTTINYYCIMIQLSCCNR